MDLKQDEKIKKEDDDELIGDIVAEKKAKKKRKKKKEKGWTFESKAEDATGDFDLNTSLDIEDVYASFPFGDNKKTSGIGDQKKDEDLPDTFSTGNHKGEEKNEKSESNTYGYFEGKRADNNDYYGSHFETGDYYSYAYSGTKKENIKGRNKKKIYEKGESFFDKGKDNYYSQNHLNDFFSKTTRQIKKSTESLTNLNLTAEDEEPMIDKSLRSTVSAFKGAVQSVIGITVSALTAVFGPTIALIISFFGPIFVLIATVLTVVISIISVAVSFVVTLLTVIVTFFSGLCDPELAASSEMYRYAFEKGTEFTEKVSSLIEDGTEITYYLDGKETKEIEKLKMDYEKAYLLFIAKSEECEYLNTDLEISEDEDSRLDDIISGGYIYTGYFDEIFENLYSISEDEDVQVRVYSTDFFLSHDDTYMTYQENSYNVLLDAVDNADINISSSAREKLGMISEKRVWDIDKKYE